MAKVKHRLKVYKYIKGICLLCTCLICILYILYIVGVAIVTYLYNRPIRQAVLYISIAIIAMIIDTVNENRTKAMRTHRTNRHTRQQMQ